MVGVYEEDERAFVASVHGDMREAIPSITAGHELTDETLKRPAVRDAAAVVADDYRQRGATPRRPATRRRALGASVKLESTARGVSGGLRFLSLTTGVLGLVVGLFRWWAPGPPLRRVTR